MASYESTPGATYKGIAADLGVSGGSLRAWVLRARALRGEEPARPSASSDTGHARQPAEAGDEAAERIRQLEERVRELEASEKKLTTERDILRKAAKYFAGQTHW
ncbi:transposase [Nonomuraea angiospora]|uniref:transposase n=1 Tax=Nonomuraea angiospora TaxID=46172 RepID=UPI003790AACD